MVMNKKIKLIALATAMTCAVAGFAGCGGKEAVNTEESSNKVTYWTALSGNASQITSDLAELGIKMDIPLLDHIIIGDNEYFSFKETNNLQNM